MPPPPRARGTGPTRSSARRRGPGRARTARPRRRAAAAVAPGADPRSASEPQRRAVAPQPAFVPLVVRAALADQAPEARRVVENLEVGDLVLDHVVEDL